MNDEIGADDWLIPRQEITRRKLIKRTPRFMIYKADWFGDVLVYEPIGQDLASRRRINREIVKTTQCNKLTPSSETIVNNEAFRIKLNELCLDLNHNSISEQLRTTGKLGGGDDDGAESDTDSAYSSISSTPQYHTKHNLSHEFEFPSSAHTHTNSNLSTKQETQKTPKTTRNKPTSPPVVLNRNSFSFGCETVATHDATNQVDGCPVVDTDGWFELNELRLVAHENFMLFMGASPNEETRALVMEMSHPKSISLHDLLHATERDAMQLGELSPRDR